MLDHSVFDDNGDIVVTESKEDDMFFSVGAKYENKYDY